LIALFGYLLWVNWSLTLLTLGILLPLIFTMRIISRRAKRLNVQMQKAAEEPPTRWKRACWPRR
jgi:ABC transporter transmembrane region.